METEKYPLAPEVLLQILLHLDRSSLVASERVCRRWQAVINGDAELRRRLMEAEKYPLPTEVLLQILAHLDRSSLAASEGVCRRWKAVINVEAALWRRLVRRQLADNPRLRPILGMQIYLGACPASLKRLYRCLVRSGDIAGNMKHNRFRKVELDCEHLTTTDGRRHTPELREEWNKCAGSMSCMAVVDCMVPSDNRLFVSLPGAIQVWDLESYSLEQVIDKKSLDERPVSSEMTELLAVHKDMLIYYRRGGCVKVFDVETNVVVHSMEVPPEIVVGMKASNDSLYTLDVQGRVSHFVFEWVRQELVLSSRGSFTDPPVVAGIQAEEEGVIVSDGRHTERLLDCNADYVVTTQRRHLTYYRKGEFVRRVPAPGNIRCISLNGNLLAFGCAKSAGLLNLDEQQGQQAEAHIQSRNTVCSINLTDSHLFLLKQDRLHLVDVRKLRMTGGTYNVVGDSCLEREIGLLQTFRDHLHGSSPLTSDPFRIFIGGSKGRIRVHDYLMMDRGQLSTDE